VKAIVVAATSGMGAAIARRMARRSPAELLLVDNDATELDSLAAELRGGGANITPLECDAARADFGDLVIAEAEVALGGIDVLITGSNVSSTADMATLTLDDYDRLAAVNARSAWLVAKAAYPHLKKTRGCIVAVSSLAAENPTHRHGSYSASQATLVMIVRQLAYEWGPDGIRCNSVSPGSVRTPATAAKYDDPGSAARQSREATIPLGRLGDPSEIAAAVDFLASADASYVTGVNLLVDGGWSTTLCRP
jgi:NAD(P)-dependent dehydrogenase (short-subunit alcohol dehydrogenase family)